MKHYLSIKKTPTQTAKWVNFESTTLNEKKKKNPRYDWFKTARMIKPEKEKADFQAIDPGGV